MRPSLPPQPQADHGAAEPPAQFSIPIATHVVDRPRLHARLTVDLKAGTTLVAATAGWGKTLLAMAWIAAGAGGRRVAWVNLNRTDDDERTFWRALATALLPVVDEAARADLGRVPVADGAELPSVLARALSRLQRPAVLVLDNLHEVQSPQIHAGLLRLVERPLPMLSLLVTTRRDPPWPLQRLRLAGVLSEIRATDLAFRTDEATTLFVSLGLALTPLQVDRLVERTEGWAAGLRLAALHLLRCDDLDQAVDTFSGDDHSVAGYLLTEVLDYQAPELIAFLERISVVDLVSPGLADALTGAGDGESRLAELAASHLFVQAVGPSGRWYRLHRLIVDILRARPMPTRDRRDLHRRAAEWFRDHDMPLDALDAALSGGLWRLAAELVGRHLVALALGGQGYELERMLADMPRAALLGHPELAVGLAGARAVQGVAAEVARLLETARAGAARLPDTSAQRLGVLLDLVTAALARVDGDLDRAAAVFQRVPLDSAVLTRLRLAGAELVPVVVRNNVGTAGLWSGNLPLAAEYLTAAADHGSGPLTLPHLNAAAHLALLQCERGELGAAQSSAREVIEAAADRGWASTPQAVCAYLTMARIVLDRDELIDLDSWLQRIADVESVAPEPHIRLAAALVLAAWREAAGDHERALNGLRATHTQLAPWAPPRGLAEHGMLTEATLLARSGDATAALKVLTALGEPRTEVGAVGLARVRLLLGEIPVAPPAGPHPRIRLAAYLVDTLAAVAEGAEERALGRLEEALLSAAPHGLRRPFLADAVDLQPRLQQRVERGTAVTGFAVDLLQRMAGDTVDELAARRALIDPLTEREQTVLRYLASSLSNAEIADELYVSINTVKTHQRTVYRKLGVRGRREAVRRAHALQLI
jgi:LuxR family maltose regulon positive regulatory protein